MDHTVKYVRSKEIVIIYIYDVMFGFLKVKSNFIQNTLAHCFNHERTTCHSCSWIIGVQSVLHYSNPGLHWILEH